MEKDRHEDDLFKKILENYPDFEPSESDLNDMKSRLDQADNSNRKSGFGMWWIPLLLLPFIFISGFLFYQNQELNKQVQSLNSKLITIQEDTIQHKFITYHYDTIYNTTYLNQVVSRKSKIENQNSSISVLNNLENISRFFSTPLPNDYFNLKNNYPTQNPFIYDSNNTFTSLQLYNIYQEKNKIDALENRPKDRFGNLLNTSNNINTISSLFLFLEESENENVLLKDISSVFEGKKKRRNPLRHFTPKGVSLGISGSPYSLTKIRANTFRQAFSYGIDSEIDFTKNVKLLLGVRKMDMTFEEKDPMYTALYPSNMPNDPTDVLRELYVTLNQVQVPISMKYLFSNNKKWQPFFSVGIVASRPLQQKFEYKYISTSLTEYEEIQNFSEGAFSVKNFEGALGFETNLTSRISGSARIYYLHDFELDLGEYFLYRNTGLNISLKYKL